MLKAIAIDDETLALEVVKAHAQKVSYLQLLQTFTNPLEGLEYLKSNPVDLLFLDIKMPDLSGLELKTLIPKNILVIFTTAYSEHAVKGFELDVLDYLLKPFSLSRFIQACDKALQLKKLRNYGTPDDYIFVKSGNGDVKVTFSELIYCESKGNYLHFELKNSSFASRMTLKDLLTLLPPYFIQCHRSFVINKHLVDRIEPNAITVFGKTIPVGSKYMVDAYKRLAL
jgi:two-component system, LytTR family, response regulator